MVLRKDGHLEILAACPGCSQHRAATSDEFIKGHLFQSCQPSDVLLELSSRSVRLFFLETEFQKALKKQAVLYFQNKMHKIL